MPLQSNIAFAAVAPDDVPIPSSGYYAFFVSDGTASGVSGPTVAGGFYKKAGVTGVVTALIPVAYSNEDAQDAVLGALTDSATVDFTYDDGGGLSYATVVDGSITNAMLSDMASARFKGRVTGGSGTPEDLTGTQATTLLDPATTALKGLMSAVDKARNDNWYNVAQYNVLDWGVAPANTGAANVTAMNTLLAAAVDNATIFFPPGPMAYDFASVVAIPGGKHLRFLGGGSQKSMIRTTSATAHIFTVGDWYNCFEGLKFTTSVTRTAGAAIYGGNNVGINVKNCDFLSMYDGIVYAGGSSAGNLAVVHECNWSDTRHWGIQVDGTNCNAIFSKLVMDGTLGQQVAGIEINACGSLIISDSDLIRCQNNLNLNPDSGTKGVFAVYCSNVFFDTSSGSSVKFSSGASAASTAIQRVKFVNCVAGETLVHTSEGLIEAQDLEGRDIPTLSDGGVYRTAQWRSFGEQELFKVRFKNGDEILATAGHEWVVTGKHGRRDKVTTLDLVGRCVPIIHRAEFEYDEPSYLDGVRHGLIYGDGTLTYNTDKSHIYQFGDSKDLVERFFADHSVQSHERYPEGVAYAGKMPASYKTDLPSVEKHGESYVRGFIAGLVAADGYVNKKGGVYLHQSDEKVLSAVRWLAAAVGLPSTSLTKEREFNPWTGEPAPNYRLTFVKAGFYDEHMVLKENHRSHMFGSPPPSLQTTMRVDAVERTGRVEKVYCCIEPETHTWVAGPGYLTKNCWFSGSVNGVELASGTRTNLPSAIDFLNCDIYSNSANGILATAVQDFSMSNCRVAGNLTAGVNVVAAAGSVTKFNLQNNTFGPTGGIAGNGIGINIQAGVYGAYVITGNNVAGNTSNLNIVDLGTTATTDLKQTINNPGRLMQGLISSFATTAATSGVTETLMHATRIPANAVIVGQMFKVRMVGINASTGILTFKVRVGAVGTVAGDTAVAWTSAASTAGTGTNGHGGCEVGIVVRSIGSGGTVQGDGVGHGGGAGAAVIPTLAGAAATAAVNTTNPWFIDVTATCSVGTFTAQVISVEAL